MTAPLEASLSEVAAPCAMGSGVDHRLRFVLNSAVDYGIVLLDLDGKVTFWNDGAAKIFGWTDQDMVGLPAEVIFTPEDRKNDVAAQEMRAALAQGRGNDERWHLRKDGSRFWASGEIMPLRDEAHAACGFIKVLRDRTEAQRTEVRTKALLALGDRLRNMADPAAMGAVAAEIMGRSLAAARAGYATLDERNEKANVDGHWAANHVAMISGQHEVRRFGSFIDELIAGETVVIEDVQRDARTADNAAAFQQMQVGSLINIPIVEHGKLVALFFVHDVVPRVWTLGELGFARGVADRTRAEVERRQAERQLAIGEESLRLATDAAEIGTWDLDLTRDLLTWSDRTKRMFGFRADATCTMADFYAGLHPEDRAATSAALADALDPTIRASYDVEYRAIGHDDGVTRWVAAKGKGQFDDEGRCVRVLGTAIDITARKTAEARLRESEAMLAESEAKFRSFAQAMPNHVWASRPDGELDWFNERVYEYSGKQVGELDGTAWTSIVHPDDLDAAATRWSAALKRGSTYEAEFRLRRRDGAYRWHLARAVPIRDASREIVRWIGTNTDIEDQKRTSSALEHLNATLEQRVAERTAERDRMWRLSTDVMLVLDFQGTIRAVNPAWAQLGWTDAEMLGKSIVDFIHPEDHAASVAEVGRLSRGATTFNFENRYARKDGGWCTLAWTAVPDEQYIHAVGRDVTVERAAAEALSRTEEALRQSQKMEAVGQLTGGLAHDFNNLLVGITGSLELLQRRIEQGRLSEVERYITTAQGAARRAAALTHRLLAFSRRQTLDPRTVRVDRLVIDMEELIKRTVGPQVALEVLGGSDDLWPARVDTNQLENALLNLCINARDAMPEGGTLTIETSNRYLNERMTQNTGLAPGPYVAVSVSDSGTGMTAEVSARAFDPFFTTKPMGSGTGLGLSMVYGFARQSGGHASIYSEAGLGTTVCIYLPRQEGDDSIAIDEAATGEPAQATPGQTVMVVDDEPAVRAVVREVLGEHGYISIEASDGATALAMLQTEVRVDLLLTDVGLPGGINGRQLADAGRTLRPGLKVLFITGYAENAVVRDGHLEPGMSIITKPFSLANLSTRIAAMIGAVPP